jgi:hypothetical protein
MELGLSCSEALCQEDGNAIELSKNNFLLSDPSSASPLSFMQYQQYLFFPNSDNQLPIQELDKKRPANLSTEEGSSKKLKEALPKPMALKPDQNSKGVEIIEPEDEVKSFQFNNIFK